MLVRTYDIFLPHTFALHDDCPLTTMTMADPVLDSSHVHHLQRLLSPEETSR